MYKFFICFVLLSRTCYSISTVGGEISYECLGEGETEDTKSFRFNFNYYVECSSTDSDEFTLLIFEGATVAVQVTCMLDSSVIIKPPNYPCAVISTDFCIEKRYYSFEVDLPEPDSSYYLIYQNCCRASEIDNINNSQITGISLFIELTPEAYAICNSSPQNLKAPPTILCIAEAFELDLSATDQDGHQLVYELYHQFDWNLPHPGTFDYWPYRPPPYPTLDYIFPYHYLQPLGPDSPFFLDANTGILTGNPQEVGFFAFGITIKEYQNGDLLSTTYQDFQVRIDSCAHKVSASLVADEITNDDTYIINLCNENEIILENTSSQMEYINDFYWQFEMGDSSIISGVWHPSLSFSDGGSFTGTLILNPDGICADTAEIVLNVVPEIKANFDIEYDTCVGGIVEFENLSYTIGSSIEKWNWHLGDDTIDSIAFVQHLYSNPGNYSVQLQIEDEFACQDSITIDFDWLPAPPVLIVAPNSFAGCSPLAVYFENLSSPVDSTYEVTWDFGDGQSNSLISPSHRYETTGEHDVFLSIISPIGCSIDTVFPNLISVKPAPIANFVWSPEVISRFNPTVHFQSTSERAVSWQWNFDDENFSYTDNDMHTFIDTGYQSVSLIIVDEYGCQDSITQIVDVQPEITYHLPNAFTPNFDGTNDIFKGVGKFDGIRHFQLSIWDRWGGKIFETTDPYQGWDGTYFSSQAQVPNGVYICHIKYQEPRGGNIEIKTTVALIR